MKIPELLAPAGDFISLRAAVEAGCNSVYFGVKGLNMRASARNFAPAEFKKLTGFCHRNNVKAYLCLNTIVYENELLKIRKILAAAQLAKVDAVICWDLAVVAAAKEFGLHVHLSTQASVSNSEAAKAYAQLGVKRIVLARECTLRQIKDIRKRTNLELECFIHGARCISVSGRCLISQELFRKSANRGECLQPCRRAYKLIDLEEAHELEVRHNYVLSPKDLCALPFIDRVVSSGVDSLKIEGRTRAPEYVKAVVSVYRRALDALSQNKFSHAIRPLISELKAVYNRGLGPGFFLGMPANDYSGVYGGKASSKKQFIGVVRNYYNKIGVAEIKLQCGNLKIGDKIMVQGPTTGVKEMVISSLERNRKRVMLAKKGQGVAIKIGFKARKNDKVFLQTSRR